MKTYRPQVTVHNNFAEVHVDESHRPGAEAEAARLNKAFSSARYSTKIDAEKHAARAIGRTNFGVVLLPDFAEN